MRKLLFGVCMLFVSFAFAQQNPQFTQYRSNMLSVNPAYAGSRDALTLAALARRQWVGIDGAPETQSLTIHSPIFHPNIGGGISVVHDVIGPVNNTNLVLDLSGRVEVGSNKYLAAGLKFGFDFFKSNLTSISTSDIGDLSFSKDVSLASPNIGLGLYYYAPKFYAGISAPRLLQNELFNDQTAIGDYSVTEKRHYYTMVGFLLPFNASIKFKPSALVKVVEGAPTTIDLTASFIFDDKVWLGGFHRLQESLGMIIAYNFTPQFKVGYSYDYSLTKIQDFNSGSHEISLTYDFIFKGDRKIKSPRYF